RVGSLFCQSEYGIRDFHVTGVQTCALPFCGDAVIDLVESAVALIGTPTSDDDRRLARELHDQASSLARRRGLPVPVRSSLIRVASTLASLAVTDRAADEREQRHALAEALRCLEDEASRSL